MERLVELTGADLCEYTDGKKRTGVFGYIGACIASMKRTLPKVTIKGDVDLAAYGKVKEYLDRYYDISKMDEKREFVKKAHSKRAYA